MPQKPASYTSPQPDETKKRPNPKASHRTDSHCSAAATKGREDAADAATLGNPTALEENGPIYTNHKLLRLNETKQDSPTAIKELNSSLKAWKKTQMVSTGELQQHLQDFY